MHPIVLIISLYIIAVLGYPASRFLIEIQEPTIGTPLTRNVMITENIQTYYENLLDEVISSHSEEFLLSMTYSMTKEKMETIYRPQVSLLLGNNDPARVHDVCLYRMPHWIGKHLHDTHAKTYEMVAPMIQSYMYQHWNPLSRRQQQEMTPSDIKELLVQLNHDLIDSIEQAMLDPRVILSDLSIKLQTCQQNYDIIHSSILKRIFVRFFGSALIKKPKLGSAIGDDLQGDMQHHFLVKYLKDMRSDLIFQMKDSVSDLAQSVQDDLNDEFISD